MPARGDSRRAKLLVGGAFGLLVAVAAGAPFMLLLIPNPHPVRIASSLPSQPPGVYIETAGTTYHVFPRAHTSETLPSDSLTTGGRPVVWVRYRMEGQRDAYGIFALGGTRVPASVEATHSGLLAITPQRELSPGAYYARVARDDLLGGTDYAYFAVSASRSAEASPTMGRR